MILSWSKLKNTMIYRHYYRISWELYHSKITIRHLFTIIASIKEVTHVLSVLISFKKLLIFKINPFLAIFRRFWISKYALSTGYFQSKLTLLVAIICAQEVKKTVGAITKQCKFCKNYSNMRKFFFLVNAKLI